MNPEFILKELIEIVPRPRLLWHDPPYSSSDWLLLYISRSVIGPTIAASQSEAE